jgi:hypothetical protein
MSFRLGRRHGGAAVVLGGCLVVSASAWGGFTSVNPPPSGEKSIKQILDQVYGGSFTANGVNFTNGSKFATRIHDTPEAGSRAVTVPTSLVYDPYVLNAGFQTDQVWSADSVDADARAKFALFSQKFGFAEGVAAVNYQNLMNVSGNGFDQSATASLDNMSNRIWRWGRDGDNGVFTSQISDNEDEDHMITYRIDNISRMGDENVTTYLLFWEDKYASQNSDFDFNDMVVEIRSTSAVVPEPSAIGAVMALSGLMLRRRRA